jgi:hypothetical protein
MKPKYRLSKGVVVLCLVGLLEWAALGMIAWRVIKVLVK